MFHKAYLFNGDISKWRVLKVTTMNGMFYNARSMNSDLSMWEIDKVNSMNWDSNNPTWKIDAYTSMNSNPSAGYALQRMFNGATSFDRTLCHTKWKTLDAFVDGYGRSGCCDSGSYMTNQHLNPFNATDGEGSCQQCPSGWMSMSAYPNANSNCTICGPGTSSISKSTNCKACARGRILTRINPLLWYVIHVAFFIVFYPPVPRCCNVLRN